PAQALPWRDPTRFQVWSARHPSMLPSTAQGRLRKGASGSRQTSNGHQRLPGYRQWPTMPAGSAAGEEGLMTMPFVKRALLGALAILLVFAGAATLLGWSRGGEGRIVMATGNPQYHDLASTYVPDLQQNGVVLELRAASEGFATLRALGDDSSGITAGFVKG